MSHPVLEAPPVSAPQPAGTHTAPGLRRFSAGSGLPAPLVSSSISSSSFSPASQSPLHGVVRLSPLLHKGWRMVSSLWSGPWFFVRMGRGWMELSSKLGKQSCPWSPADVTSRGLTRTVARGPALPVPVAMLVLEPASAAKGRWWVRGCSECPYPIFHGPGGHLFVPGGRERWKGAHVLCFCS